MKITTVYTEESAIGVATIWQKAIFTFRSAYAWKFHGFRLSPVMYDPNATTVLLFNYAWVQMTFEGIGGAADLSDGLPGYEVSLDADSNLSNNVNAVGTPATKIQYYNEKGFLVDTRSFVTCVATVYGNFTANTLGTMHFDLFWDQATPFGK